MKSKSSKKKQKQAKPPFNPDANAQATQALVAEYMRCHPLAKVRGAR